MNMANIYQTELFAKIHKLHTTPMGINRIKRNLELTCEEPVAYCRNIIMDKDCFIYRNGKNWYCERNDIRITINAYSFTIITAHKLTKK